MTPTQTNGRELTGAQTGVAGYGTGSKSPLARKKSDTDLTFAKIRELRLDPTVKLGRMFIVGPALEAGWTVEAADGVPDEVRDFVEDQLKSVHDYVMERGLLDLCDFGWAPFEVVLAVQDGRVVLKKLKELYVDVTTILVDEKGRFGGLKNRDVVLETEQCLLISQMVEGTNWYGEADMDAVWRAMKPYESVNEAGIDYDDKIAGTTFVVYYPEGITPNFEGRSNVDNFEVAKSLLEKLEQRHSGLAVPRLVDVAPDLLENNGWKIDLLTDAGQGGSYLMERAKYLDTLKARAFGIPERAILEGKYGTLAEAETHGDIAVINLNIRRKTVIRHVNWHLVNSLLRLNFGRQYENRVWVKPNPLNDTALVYARRVLDMIMAGQSGLEVVDQIDTDALLERVDLPVRSLEELAPPPAKPAAKPAALSKKIKDAVRRAVGGR